MAKTKYHGYKNKLCLLIIIYIYIFISISYFLGSGTQQRGL